MRHSLVEEDLVEIVGHKLPWHRLRGKTVLISGANGFLPAYMVETILWLNERCSEDERTTVVGLVRNETKARERFRHYRGRDDFRLIVRDVCMPVAIEGPVDFIIHAASQASPKYYGIDPVGTLSANVLGTHNLLELARIKGSSRFLFFSSGEVYGNADTNVRPIDERSYGYLDPLDVRSCYAESKRMGENMTVCWHRQFSVPTMIVRPFHSYGPGMDLTDGRVFADFVADVVAGRNIVMRSDGKAVRAFCYLADAVAGFFTVLFNGKLATAYNIGNDQCEVSIADLAELLVGLFPEKGLRVIREKRPDESAYLKSNVSRICPDISRALTLGWKPSIGLNEGFTRTIRSFYEHETIER